ncbi:hypothetical protein GCM10010495_44570 [Kitasatospora herbaricolor]|nr:hypothetical protein [Kitasatospora herbaricolor]GGV23974.1 hypothetical protein GCM10010495_44570 [Kitasatospora herbaricolor]
MITTPVTGLGAVRHRTGDRPGARPPGRMSGTDRVRDAAVGAPTARTRFGGPRYSARRASAMPRGSQPGLGTESSRSRV